MHGNGEQCLARRCSVEARETHTDTIYHALPDIPAALRVIQEQMLGHVSGNDLRLLKVKMEASGALCFVYTARQRGSEEWPFYVRTRTVPPVLGKALEEQLNRQYATEYRHADEHALARGAVYAEDLRLLLQMFHVDRGLPSLPQVVSAAVMQPLFSAMFARTTGQELTTVKASVVQYCPGQKCLIRYHLRWRSPSTSAEQEQVIYGKVGPKALQAYKRLEKIYTAWQGAVFHLPRPLGVLPELCIAFVEALPGRPLSLECLRSDFPEICRRVARGLLEFQHIPVMLEERRSVAAELAHLERWSRAFIRLLPAQAAQIRQIVQGISEALVRQQRLPLCLVHGDFHVANILVEGMQLGLLDFENSGMGHPILDVGAFYAQVKLLALKQFRTHTALDAGLRSFLTEYEWGCPAPYRASIPMYCALSCLWCAYFQCLRRPGKAGWMQRALEMLQLAANIVQQGFVYRV